MTIRELGNTSADGASVFKNGALLSSGATIQEAMSTAGRFDSPEAIVFVVRHGVNYVITQNDAQILLESGVNAGTVEALRRDD